MPAVQENISLVEYTTLGVGGMARYLVRVTTVAELVASVSWARYRSVPFYILGGGSNVLFLDHGVSGLVIQIMMRGISILQENDEYVLIEVAAGENFDDCIAYTVQHGWWGLENLSYIPGSVGATPVQNVGAYGVEVKDVIDSVIVYDTATETQKKLSNSDCQFGYRDSLFKQQGGRYIITSVVFRLSKIPRPVLSYNDLQVRFSTSPQPTQLEIRDCVITIRKNKFPDWRYEGTAGSFFKNPIIPKTQALDLLKQYPNLPVYDVSDELVKISLGYVLDKICGLKGYQKNGVRLYEQQALVLVTQKKNHSAVILEFATEIIERVKEKINVTIETEVTIIR